MTLHLYIARRFLGSFLVVSGAFVAILVLLEFVEQIRRSGDEATMTELFGLTLLRVPETLYDILPLMVILATLALFLSLARSSEMVVTRAAGRSALSTLLAPVLTAMLVGALALAVLNPIVAATTKRYETLSDRYAGQEPSVLSIGRDGLWLRQGDDEGGQIVIRADRVSADGTELYDVGFVGFGPDGGPAFRIEAARAALEPGAWALSDAKEWRFDGNGNPEREAEVHQTYRLPSELTREQIRDSFGAPSSIPIWELPAFIERLEQAGFSARQHRVWFQMELANPLLLAAMVLTAAAFTLRHSRVGRTGIMVLMALALGFTLYFIRNFAQILGDNGQIPVALAAWGPPLAAILLPLGLLLHLEEG